MRRRNEPLVYNSFEELLEILAEERRKSLKRRRSTQIIAAILGLVFCLSMLMAMIQHVHFSGFGSILNILPGIIAGMYALTEKQRKGLQALAAFDDVRAVPHLLTALEYTDGELKAVAANTLPGLLPKLQASDASLLTREHRAILNRALKTDLTNKTPRAALRSKLNMKTTAFPQLRVAILQALQQVGDASSLPIVEEMADGKGKAAGQPEVRQAAENCLPYLRLRAENQRQTQTLLRASDGNMTPPDVLLRPALPHSDTAVHPEELLRVPQSDSDMQTVLQPAYVLYETPQAEQEVRLR